MTVNQSFSNKSKINKSKINPQRKGVVTQVRIQTPRKPNSARRPIVKVSISNWNNKLSSIFGGQHNLKKYSTTLIASGGARDLPGVYFFCIRGVYDLNGVKKGRRRSIYGYSLMF